MFGNDKKKDNSKAGIMSVSATHSLNSLVQQTVVEGKVTVSHDIRIDGVIKGDLICKSKVIIGSSGTIEGSINCENAVIEGRFYGTMYVKETLNIRESAQVHAEVHYGKLVVQAGAVISGSFKVHNDKGNGVLKNPESDLLKVPGNGSAPAVNLAGTPANQRKN
ncbi:MAG: hypothetical protein RLY31_2818 [Bacteroidota bacterium]|jgi:cytoskeletal protein CcmA (bactofilin family)